MFNLMKHVSFGCVSLSVFGKYVVVCVQSKSGSHDQFSGMLVLRSDTTQTITQYYSYYPYTVYKPCKYR